MILNLEGTVDELTVLDVKLHVPFTSKHWIRLKYAHLPQLPLNNGFDEGFLWGPSLEEVSIPKFSTIEELVDILNSFRDDQNRPLLVAYYDGREFELYANNYYQVVLHWT